MDRVPTNGAIHRRLRARRGPARTLSCARCDDMASEWALVGEPKWLDPVRGPYTDDLDAYIPLCVQCHRRLDKDLPPCPHGAARDRTSDGSCRVCYNERLSAYRRKRYAEDPEYREWALTRSLERIAAKPELREAKNARARELHRERMVNDPAYREKRRAASRERQMTQREERRSE